MNTTLLHFVLRLKTRAAVSLLPLYAFMKLKGTIIHLLFRFGRRIVQGLRRRQKSLYPSANRATNDKACSLDKIISRLKG
jgi:hypothetical protein